MVYILKRDYEHLIDMSFDISLLPFEGSQDLKIKLDSDIEYFPQRPIEFLANFNIVRTESDYPIVDTDIEVMSEYMISVLESIGQFEHRTLPAVLIDDTFITPNRYDADGSLRKEIPVISNFKVVQLFEVVKAFDFEKSDYQRMRSNPDFPGIIKKLVLKRPEGGFPPIFRLYERPVTIFVSLEAKEALIERGIKGCVFEPVLVS